MNKRILLGVDADLSFATQYALRTAGEFMVQIAPEVDIVLLHVIPLVQTMVAHPGMYTGQVHSITEDSAQKARAVEMLHKARLLLQEQGVHPERCEGMIRMGTPAEEIAKVARDLQVAMIIVGSRGSAFREQVRRFFVGSLSRRVLQLAPCPVLVAAPPGRAQVANLVSWYTEAITQYLRTHPHALSVFTPEQVAQQFAPAQKSSPGRREVHAAAEALEQLADKGFLFRHSVKGELRYVND